MKSKREKIAKQTKLPTGANFYKLIPAKEYINAAGEKAVTSFAIALGAAVFSIDIRLIKLPEVIFTTTTPCTEEQLISEMGYRVTV